MAINFPNSPQAGDPHSEAGIDWVYDGEKWVAQSEATFWARTNSTLSPSTAGDNISTTGDLTAGCTTTGTGGASGTGQVVGYQQGTWTPLVTAFTTAPTGEAYTANNSTWWRIGSVVTVTCNVTFSNNGTGGVGGVSIFNLPYSVSEVDTNAGFGGVVHFVGNAGISISSISARVVGSTDAKWNGGFVLLDGFSGTGSTSMSTYNWQSIVSDTFTFRFTASYLTEDTTLAPSNGATIS